MKKLFILLFAALLLAGCAADSGETSPPTVPEETVGTTEATEPTQSFYVADTPMERGTAGAVRVYRMESPVTGISTLGGGLLVCTDGQQLYLLDKQTMSIVTQRELECAVDWNQSDLVITDDRLAYYDTGSGSYTVLDSDLLTVSAAQLNTGSGVLPVISPDMETIFYAGSNGIHALELSTGTSRTLRQEHEQIVSLDGVYFNGTLLRYTRRLSGGALQDCFISAENGRLYDTAAFQDELATWDDFYVTMLEQSHPFGTLQYLLTGQWDGEDHVLTLTDGWDKVLFPGEGLALIQRRDSVGLVVSCYDLLTGTLISQVTMPQIYSCFASGFADGGSIWLWNGDSGEFYCWDTAATSITGETSLFSSYSVITDKVSSPSYNKKARTLSEQYKVKITIMDGDNRTDGLDYSVYPDYREDYYNTALELLEQALKQFPDGFLKTMAKKTSSGYLQIHLTDDFDPATGILNTASGCDLTNKEITISVSMCDETGDLFIHQLYSAIETKILNYCDDLNKWYKLNPEEFEYGNGSIYGQYIEDSNRYFVNAESLTAAREDRAQLFLAAMEEGNDLLFESKPMQKKLKELCRLIRKAYSLSGDDILPWEQYLN